MNANLHDVETGATFERTVQNGGLDEGWLASWGPRRGECGCECPDYLFGESLGGSPLRWGSRKAAAVPGLVGKVISAPLPRSGGAIDG